MQYRFLGWFIVSGLLGGCLTCQAATRLGLHITQEEIYCWRQRAQIDTQGANGITCPVKYRTAGDVSTNSPGDWTRITTVGAQLQGNPTQETWTGNTSGAPWNQSTQCGGADCVPTEARGYIILDAAFAYLLAPATFNWVSAVRTALLSQATTAGTDFTNTALWPDAQIGDGNSFGITTWLTKLAFAYSYVRSNAVFSSAERLQLDTWFSNAAYYWGKNVNYLIQNNTFPQRNTEFDTSVAIGSTYPTSIGSNSGNAVDNVALYWDCTLNARVHSSGTFHEFWNNRSASQVRFSVVGSLLNGTLPHDAQSQRWAKMWFKEWLTYGTFSDNTIHEYRWWNTASNIPTLGWRYAAYLIGAMTTVADTFARLGDTSLYTFVTSAGINFGNAPAGINVSTIGGPKSLQGVIQRHYGFVNQRATSVPNWTGSDNVTFAGGPHCGADRLDYLIQPNDVPRGETSVADTLHIPSNLYYQDNAYKLAYTRTVSGAPPYPSGPVSTGNNPWNGEWGVYPGVLFMFGQMEGVVNPYTLGAGPSAPTLLRLVR